jgi:hypothetical protein
MVAAAMVTKAELAGRDGNNGKLNNTIVGGRIEPTPSSSGCRRQYQSR